MNREEKISYLILFCALMLTKHSRATLEELVVSLPLIGRGQELASALVNPIQSTT